MNKYFIKNVCPNSRTNERKRRTSDTLTRGILKKIIDKSTKRNETTKITRESVTDETIRNT